MSGSNVPLHARNHRAGGSDPLPKQSDYDAIVENTAGRMLDFHFDEASGNAVDSIIGAELEPFETAPYLIQYRQPGAMLDDPTDYSVGLPGPVSSGTGTPIGAYFRGPLGPTEADVGSSITVEAWVKVGADPVGLAAIANRGWTLRIRAGLGIQWVTTPTDELITPDEAVEVGEWSYIVATYEDDEQMHVYVNGALVGSQDVAGGGPVDEGAYLNVGLDETVLANYHLRGSISRLIVWNVALSGEEVGRRAIAANIGGGGGAIEWEDVGDEGGGGGVESPNVQQDVFDANGTWTKPDGCAAVEVVCIGAGGGGAGGARTNAASAVPGGGGGGGGAVLRAIFSADDLTSTVAVTVGAGGSGGAGGTAGATIPGSDGGLSSFGSYLRAGGGGRAPATAGAGAGGALSSASSGTAGTPAGSATGGIATQGVPGAGAAVAGSSSESGGASGGGGGSGGTGIGGAGGGSIYGGPGGGGGGAVLTGGTQAVGGQGGGTQRYGTAGLASNGGAAGTAVAPDAADGATFAGPFCGSGGGGGAAFGIAGTGGGAGGDGGIGAGGGGGGASNDDVPAPINAGGPGGAGGNGRVVVISYLEPV